MVTVGALGLAFICLILALTAQRMLLPGIVILGSFIMFVLFLTGLIETAVQEFGPGSAINSVCQSYITGMPSTGVSLNTLAWLEQQTICKWRWSV